MYTHSCCQNSAQAISPASSESVTVSTASIARLQESGAYIPVKTLWGPRGWGGRKK